MIDIDMEQINQRWPTWIDDVGEIGCTRTRGELILWLVEEHAVTELIAESIWADNFVAEYIMEVFNPERKEALYEKTRDAMWRFSEEILLDCLIEENTRWELALREEAYA